jgi:hypothetical protein
MAAVRLRRARIRSASERVSSRRGSRRRSTSQIGEPASGLHASVSRSRRGRTRDRPGGPSQPTTSPSQPFRNALGACARLACSRWDRGRTSRRPAGPSLRRGRRLHPALGRAWVSVPRLVHRLLQSDRGCSCDPRATGRPQARQWLFVDLRSASGEDHAQDGASAAHEDDPRLERDRRRDVRRVARTSSRRGRPISEATPWRRPAGWIRVRNETSTIASQAPCEEGCRARVEFRYRITGNAIASGMGSASVPWTLNSGIVCAARIVAVVRAAISHAVGRQPWPEADAVPPTLSREDYRCESCPPRPVLQLDDGSGSRASSSRLRTSKPLRPASDPTWSRPLRFRRCVPDRPAARRARSLEPRPPTTRLLIGALELRLRFCAPRQRVDRRAAIRSDQGPSPAGAKLRAKSARPFGVATLRAGGRPGHSCTLLIGIRCALPAGA